MNISANKSRNSKGAARRQREKEFRRKAIIQAAETLFAQKGYRKTRIEDIAGEAEVSVGTVYGYFKNKEDLLRNVLDEIGKYVRRLMGEEFRKGSNTMEGIRLSGTAFFQILCLSHPDKLALFYDESIGHSQAFQRARKEWSHQMIDDVRKAMIQIRDALGVEFQSGMSPEIMAVCTVGVFDRLGYYYQLGQKDSEELMALGKETVSFVVGGMQSLLASNNLGDL